MVETEEVFLIDSNSFMTPYRQYYAFDLVPTYWKKLSEQTTTGKIVLLDMVKAEIETGGDALAKWIGKEKGFVVCNHVTSEIVGKYGEIMRYIQDCGLYKEQAKLVWASAHVADPWLIAAAAVNAYTIITAEVASGGLSRKTPNKNAKIPDVAKAFGVPVQNLYYMMRKLEIRI